MAEIIRTCVGGISIKWTFIDFPIASLFKKSFTKFLEQKNKAKFYYEVDIKLSDSKINYNGNAWITTKMWDLYDNGKQLIFVASSRFLSNLTAIIDKDTRHISVQTQDKTGTILVYHFSELLYNLALLNFSGIMLHACGVVYKNEAFIFMGPSGSGKTTIARKALPHNILNDEKIILRLWRKNIYAYGTPWHGEHSICNNIKITCRNIYFLDVNKEKSYNTAIKRSESLAQIIRNSCQLSSDREYAAHLLSIGTQIAGKSSCSFINFNKNDNIGQIISRNNKMRRGAVCIT
jgi:hypothetical protein